MKRAGIRKQQWQRRDERLLYNQAMRYPQIKEWLLKKKERESASRFPTVSTPFHEFKAAPTSKSPDIIGNRNVRKTLRDIIDKANNVTLGISNSLEVVNNSSTSLSPSSRESLGSHIRLHRRKDRTNPVKHSRNLLGHHNTLRDNLQTLLVKKTTPISLLQFDSLQSNDSLLHELIEKKKSQLQKA